MLKNKRRSFIKQVCWVHYLLPCQSRHLVQKNKIGLKHTFLINHHGGKGQRELIEDLAAENSNQQMKVHANKTQFEPEWNPKTAISILPRNSGRESLKISSSTSVKFRGE